MVLSRCAQAPTVLDSESFLTLTSLASSDPTATLPIVLGIITYANVESSRWFASAEAQEREKKVEEWNAAKRAKGHVVVEPRKAIQTGLRTMAIVRILIAAAIPGVGLFGLSFYISDLFSLERSNILGHISSIWFDPVMGL